MNNDNSNQTLKFTRNSGLRRSDFESSSHTPSRGDVFVVAVACVVILLWVVGVI